jgi:broad specificity phosphatase PhoE
MRLILVRHCEPAWPADWVEDDVGLTERGRRQAQSVAAELVGRYLTSDGPLRIISSPARRAIETAEVIGGQAGLTVDLDDSLLGLTDPVMRRRLAAGDLDDGFASHLASLGEAAWTRLMALVEESDDAASIIVASHDVTIAAVVCLAMSMPVSDFRRFRIDMGSITVLEFRRQRQGRRTILTALNDGCHLEELNEA